MRDYCGPKGGCIINMPINFGSHTCQYGIWIHHSSSTPSYESSVVAATLVMLCIRVSIAFSPIDPLGWFVPVRHIYANRRKTNIYIYIFIRVVVSWYHPGRVINPFRVETVPPSIDPSRPGGFA